MQVWRLHDRPTRYKKLIAVLIKPVRLSYLVIPIPHNKQFRKFPKVPRKAGSSRVKS